MHVLSVILPLYLALPTTAGFLKPRATYTDCTDSQKQLLSAAVTDAGKMASAGASSLRSNSASSLFQTFFKTTDSSSMDQVASALEKIAEEASQPGGGVVTYSCSPGSINCQTGSFSTTGYASTDGTNGQVNTCPAYFDLPASSDDCTVLDQRTSALHELGHTKGVLGNEVYGYQEIMNIDTQTALSNAESYAFFAKSVFLGCGGQSGQSGQSSQSGQTGKTGSSGSISGGSSSQPKTSGTTSTNNPSGSNQMGSSSPFGSSSNTGSLGNMGSLFGNSGSLTGPGSSVESSSPYGSSGSPYGSSYGSPYGSSYGSPYGSSDSSTGSDSPMESSMGNPYGSSSGMGSSYGSENSMSGQGSSMESPPSVIDSGSQDSYGGTGNSDSYDGSDSYGDMGSSGSYDDMGSSDSYGGMGY